MKRVICAVLTLVLVLALFSGCSQAVDGVTDAAREKLTELFRSTLEKYRLEVIEVKPVVGRLNGEGQSVQFFCAALVKAGSDTLPQTCAAALSKLFEAAGTMPQTAARVESSYLVNKELAFDHRDYTEEGYYTVWVYDSVLEKSK